MKIVLKKPPYEYPLGCNVQSAAEGVPPVELLTVVQVFVVPLKFSFNIGMLSNVPPVATNGNTVSTQAEEGVVAIVITLGVGFTVTVILLVVAHGAVPVD